MSATPLSMQWDFIPRADAHQPYDLGVLGALASINREAGNIKAALAYARKAAEAAPEDPEV